MPFYYTIGKMADASAKKRTVEGLQRLRKQLNTEVPGRTVTDTLLLATWNIREFDSEKYGSREAECFHYIAEILSRFDLIAIQEVREDLRALDEVQKLLGGWWKYVVTDVTAGAGGNGERMAFLYDSRKVSFGGLAGEIVLPPKRKVPVPQFARTPFICGFRAGWVKFNLCTVHIYYGKSKPDDPQRIAEIRSLASFLADKMKPAAQRQPARPQGEVTAVRNTSGENLILLGDFNIFSQDDETFKALTEPGFDIPKPLRELKGSNLAEAKHFDQIAFLVREDKFEATKKAGVFNFTKSVYRDGDAALYEGAMGEAYKRSKKKENYYKQWRTFQMSDHALLWCQIAIDFSDAYLDRMKAEIEKPAPEPAPAPA